MSEEPDSTAVRTALWRGLHTLVDDPPHVLDDAIGVEIAGVDETWRARPDMDPARTRANRASIVARARAVEDTVIASGAGQYVILGAGLDTFAQRHKGPVRVFEIDASATQAWKRARLVQLGLLDSTRLHLVPVDFEAGESWLDKAVEAGLDPAVPTVVSMLGVTMYLTPEAISTTLRQSASLAAGSIMVFSYSRPIEMAPPEVRPILEGAAKGAAASGHPWLSLLTPDQAAGLARQAGFADVEVVTSTELHERYFAHRHDGLSPVGGEDLVIATAGGDHISPE
ncbi:class I SAM-dependent methyltransferase [Prauserella flavalba]|uniref:S-adenosyl-L-methionine-dependent methyltransferase n=1 Tax=Prauserella flavalba TaxID=1477506 RepID=A0A318M766_9PSEU|nr:class I SAM-dependent methyltransferase [Prauserella flavalba]PXY30626.1 methyltransferase [Prauserella flavalba]